MGGKDKDDHIKGKHRKKHKHNKGPRSKVVDDEESKSFSMKSQEDSEDIDIGDERNDTPTSTNRSKDEENIEIDVEDELIDDMENDVKYVEEAEIKANIKVDKLTSPKKSLKKVDGAELLSNKNAVTPSNPNQKKTRKRRDSGTSSEEERWLTAVESGKLEEIEDVELRKIKDPKLMTARQRAMYDRNNDTESAPGFSETLVALPTGYKEKEKPQTAEELQKAALKILRRKQQADEKREKDKKKTMERLLKKQESKYRTGNKPKAARETIPMISYKNTLEGAVIQLPVGVDFPLQPQQLKEPPKQQLCSIAGCNNPKVYNCSKTNLPLCSFACYRKNVQSLKEIIC